MDFSNITKQDIMKAFKLIDKNGVPERFSDEKHYIYYDGKRYPFLYTLDSAIEDGSLEVYLTDTKDLISHVESLGFQTAPPKEKYELTITAENISSTDERFDIDNLGLGDQYKPLDAFFRKGNGDIIKRAYNKGERRNSNQTLPRLACQIFEQKLSVLSVEEKEAFPICKYNPNSELICGIYTDIDEFKQSRNTIEYLKYYYGNGRKLVFYCWNVFSTIIFVQECLKRFGEPGDSFVLVYREKERKESVQEKKEAVSQEELAEQYKRYRNPYSSVLIESKNIVFRGAPGTGKSYLAKEIAADIISNGYFDDYSLLTEEQKNKLSLFSSIQAMTILTL